MEVATMENDIQEKVFEEVNAEINESIDEAKTKLAEQDFEIEVTDEKPKEKKEPEIKEKPEKTVKAQTEEDDTKYSQAVQSRIKKLLQQKRDADEEAQKLQNTVAVLNQRLEKIEKSNEVQGQNQLAEHYQVSKSEATEYLELLNKDACDRILTLYGYTAAEKKKMMKGIK